MKIEEETLIFLNFIVLGIVIAILFDFFRAIRKVKKYELRDIYLQDITFFLIVGIVTATMLIYNLEYSLRLYLFLSLFLGIVIYISTISRYVLKVFIIFIKTIKASFSFIILPLSIIKEVNIRIYKFLSNIVKICCNKIYYMIFYYYNNLKLKKTKKKFKTEGSK
ncbi:MAG: spore cortex biosynthesis protein YabQ [Clostridia bacterium]|nr:spore cortex biosynthesis protein YabQ [Clostridia bacterium]MDD4375688.1 spore cortex biosynthesis protein YabQ [Clostridia bacterium]